MPCSFIYAGQTIVNKHSQENNQQNPVSQMPTETEVNAPVTDPYTPNANMADHSDGPGLVAWKRGQSVCQSRLFPNVLIIANGCMCSD